MNKPATQADQTVNALQKLGGIATLPQLYEALHEVSQNQWNTRTSEATIRRIVQTDKRIRKIKPGLYSLHENYEKYAKRYNEESNDDNSQKYNHTFYQGLLVEIGKARDFETYVPANDRKRRFLDSKYLGDMSSLDALPEFASPKLIRQAKTVDVIWFNRRRMPHSFFEVETTTNMTRSLEKYGELQDFRADLTIIAKPNKREHFDRTIGKDVYTEFRGQVKFQSTETLVKKYEKEKHQVYMKTFIGESP